MLRLWTEAVIGNSPAASGPMPWGLELEQEEQEQERSPRSQRMGADSRLQQQQQRLLSRPCWRGERPQRT